MFKKLITIIISELACKYLFEQWEQREDLNESWHGLYHPLEEKRGTRIYPCPSSCFILKASVSQ